MTYAYPVLSKVTQICVSKQKQSLLQMKIVSRLFVSLLTTVTLPRITTNSTKHFCQLSTSPNSMNSSNSTLLERVKNIVPKLTNDRHKGQAGRIGIVGGSIEYTGAPYFAAISALKVGADLVHVFCTNSAGPVIKSYSPELIVHPLLDSDNALKDIEPWLHRLHVLVIGPGLGRDPKILEVVSQLIKLCRNLEKPLVIDADGLFLITQEMNLIKDYKGVILTPNMAEFSRLFGDDVEERIDKIKSLGCGVTIIEKGSNDRIYDSMHPSDPFECPAGGSGRRCGGQGDLMSGAIATFYHWGLDKGDENAAFIASYAGSYLTKKCNEYAFPLKGRSMLVTDMIEQIHRVFEYYFENKD